MAAAMGAGGRVSGEDDFGKGGVRQQSSGAEAPPEVENGTSTVA